MRRWVHPGKKKVSPKSPFVKHLKTWGGEGKVGPRVRGGGEGGGVFGEPTENKNQGGKKGKAFDEPRYRFGQEKM